MCFELRTGPDFKYVAGSESTNIDESIDAGLKS